MAKRKSIEDAFKDDFQKKGKKDIKAAAGSKQKKVKKIFYITKYADNKLVEYKKETGVSKSAAVELMIRQAFK